MAGLSWIYTTNIIIVGDVYTMLTIDFINFAKKVRETYKKSLKPLAHEINMSNTALEILMYLSDNLKNNTSREICRALCLKSGIVSFHVENLVKEMYLERINVDGDRRKCGLLLTEKALPIIERAKIYQAKYINALNAGLSQEDIEHIHNILLIIEHNIELMDKGGK